MNRLLNSGDKTMRMIGAWHVIRHSFEDPSYTLKADQFIEEEDVYRRLAAGIAAHGITSEEFPERATHLLIRFFNDDDEQVRGQASTVFRNIEPNDFTRFFCLFEAYLNSRAFEHDSFEFFHALENATSSVHTLVISAAEKVVSQLEANDTTRS